MKERPLLTYHRMIEAFNFVAAKETYLADPRFSDKTDEVGNTFKVTGKRFTRQGQVLGHSLVPQFPFPEATHIVAIPPPLPWENDTSMQVILKFFWDCLDT